MGLQYLDFDLDIGEGLGQEYRVNARSSAGEARAIMRFPYDELTLENRLRDLQIALLRSGSTRRQILSPEQKAVRDFGEALFEALFFGEIRTCYDVSLQQARSQGKGLRLRLNFQSPLTAALPWEYLFDPRGTEFCSLSVETPLVRYVELSEPVAALVVTPPLRILGMVCSPSDLTPLDVDQEKQRIEQATEALRETGQIELQWVPGQTWRDLQSALRQGPWHIFHFSGHGRFDTITDEGQLAFADDQGGVQLLQASEVGRLLANHRTLRVAWLNACEGARGSKLDNFSSIASILVHRGIPAVVAMQYDITDRVAIELARTFYGALVDGYPVDGALAEARVAVSLSTNFTVEWGTPVLYMRAADGVLFDLGRAQLAAPDPVRLLTRSHMRSENTRRWLLMGLIAIGVAALAITSSLTGAVPTKLGQSPTLPASSELVAKQPTAKRLPITSPTVPEQATSASHEQMAATAALATALQVNPDDTLVITQPVRMEFVRVPGGEFMMGSDPARDSAAFENEQPQHRITLPEFFIGKYEATNDQYAAFIKATGGRAPGHWQDGRVPQSKGDHPVVDVSWNDAVAFTSWLSMETGSNFRLPTEAEWEKACRGSTGLVYPWGYTFDVNKANVARSASESGMGSTTPVGRFLPDGASPYGVADMAGNVWEWAADWYSAGYYSLAPFENPRGPEIGHNRVLRGGSFSPYAGSVRCTYRYAYPPDQRLGDAGFRVVWVLPS